MSEGAGRGTLMRPVPLPDSASRPLATPLVPAVAWASRSPDALDAQYEGRLAGYTYAREGHPNADVLAGLVARMEGAADGVVTGSGMGAVTAVILGLLRAGDHVVAGDQLYGRSLRLMTEDLPRLGFTATLADATSAEAITAAIGPRTRLIVIESLSNPTLRVADLAGIAALARERGILLAVDNTFTTPRLVRPLEMGADIVIHSVTKFLGGHSDLMAGWVGARDAELLEQVRVFAVTAGFTPSPFDSWLAERGLLSFEARFERAQATAARLADHLAAHPGVERVLYPGRADHPDHARAMELFAGQGGNMVSFVLPGGRQAANAFAEAVEGVAFAPTLGDAGTTLSHPASSSHRALSPDARAALGITEGFFRVSVGLEDPAALIETFDRGLAAAARA